MNVSKPRDFTDLEISKPLQVDIEQLFSFIFDPIDVIEVQQSSNKITLKDLRYLLKNYNDI